MNVLFSARLKRLTAEELQEAFDGQAKINHEEHLWRQNSITCELSTELSLFGDLKVIYRNPEIECDYSNTVTDEQIRNAPIFTYGLDMPWFVRNFGEMFWRVDADFLMGRFDETEINFSVLESGIESLSRVSDVLLRFAADNSELTPRFLQRIQKSAKYFGEANDDGGTYYVVVIGARQVITIYGNIAKKAPAITDEDIEHAKVMLFSPQFRHACIDNGVFFGRGWVIDRYGNEIMPNSRQTSRECYAFKDDGRELKNGDLIETWTALEGGDICLSCWMSDDGEISLVYGQCGYGGISMTTHQLRKMEIIRQQIIKKLEENAGHWDTTGKINYTGIQWRRDSD